MIPIQNKSFFSNCRLTDKKLNFKHNFHIFKEKKSSEKSIFQYISFTIQMGIKNAKVAFLFLLSNSFRQSIEREI